MLFRPNRWLIYIIFALPFVLLGVYLWKYTVNAPYHDDYDWAVLFLNDYLHLDSFESKLKMVFTYHCEHRIIYARLVILSHYFLTDTLNFKNLAIWGNVGLFAIPFLFFRQLNGLDSKLFYFLPIIFLFLNLQCFPNLFTTFGLTNNTSLFLILLTLYLLNYYDSIMAITSAFLVGMFVTFTAANGMFIWLLGFLLLLLGGKNHLIPLWIFIAIFSISAYFLIEKQYWKIDFVGPRPLWIILANTPIYFPTFLLAVLDTNQPMGKLYSMFSVLILGIIILGYGWKNKNTLSQFSIKKGIHWLKNLHPNQRYLLLAIALVLMTAASCLIYRSGYGFNKWVIKDRYRIYSQLFWVCIYLWGLKIIKVPYRNYWFSFFAVISVMVWIGSYYFITPELKAFSQRNYEDLKYFSKNNTLKYYDYHEEPERKLATNKSIIFLSERGILYLPSNKAE